MLTIHMNNRIQAAVNVIKLYHSYKCHREREVCTFPQEWLAAFLQNERTSYNVTIGSPQLPTIPG